MKYVFRRTGGVVWTRVCAASVWTRGRGDDRIVVQGACAGVRQNLDQIPDLLVLVRT